MSQTPVDPVAHNRLAWDRQVEEGNEWSRPVGPEVIAKARAGQWSIVLIGYEPVDPTWFPPEIAGRDVLCLASGGGQQGPVLAAAGARVTVFDNSPRQLAQDEMVAAREGLDLRTVLGDARDLSTFPDASFDLVVHPVSNLFIPDLAPVWRECHRVLRPGGTLLSGFLNPDVYLFDAESLEARGELVVRHRPALRRPHPSGARRAGAAVGPRRAGGVQPYAHRPDRRADRGGLRHHRLRRGAAPLGRHGRLALRLLRHQGGQGRVRPLTLHRPGRAGPAMRPREAGAGGDGDPADTRTADYRS
ncbi:class I SAM-dependent methyltransferase [Streptomyces sp. DHE17-7]|uniref:class I SAM-dependent methyltransferase n=1 Tax=Streptomyces sp. DHE17-7 TaxID=2759949 RepID=UPI0022EB5A6B|nr:class I SAM-dependent methyltransferase [Streptomyces sp. DHE17-7]